MGSSPAPPAISRPTNRTNLFELPNIPNPINGMIKTYDTSHRSFTRPYSAKTVFFYKEGDHYFTGLRVPISKSRYRNMDSLLDDLNLSIPMPFGVRRLHTPYGKTPVQNLDQLQHLGRYVVSSSKYGKTLDIDAVDKHQQRMREIAKKRWDRMNQNPSTSFPPNSFPPGSFPPRYHGGFRKTLGLFLPLTAKQLFFVLNGHPGRIYRIVLSPYKKTDMETILEEVSQGLEIAIVKLYNFSGERISTVDQLMSLKESRVLAVPRHEKPILPTEYERVDSRKKKAVVTIQAYTRGHLARKRVKEMRARVPTPGAGVLGDKMESEGDYSEPEESEHFTDEEKEEEKEERKREHSLDYSEAEQSEHLDDEIERENAAITIQKHYRGYLVRKKIAEKRSESPKLETIEEGVMDTDEEEEQPRLDSAFSKDNAEEEEPGDGAMTYLVRIFTGNRWAADTETDLYIILHGDMGESEKRILQQDFINWLQSENPKFVQGQVDDFLIVVPSVGRLRKITIGHEHKGYGGGIFIDQVIVVEGGNSGRQYLFQCFKWFDSGQVDGKLERAIKCTALYYSTTANESKSQGRWELVLHNGTKEGEGGTTSNLNIFGYSHDVMSRSVDIYDNTLAKVPSTSLVQVDFGQELANLTKIRIEIDGNGDNPDYYLDYVELMDLDTEERMEVTVEKWLKWESEDKGAQAFRELVIFRGAADTLPLCTYEGKLRVLVHQIPLCNSNVKIELFGENGESGRALIRESTHTPYRMVLEHSRIVPRRDDEDSFVKELRTSRMEGLSTKLSKKSKVSKKKPPTWVVSMLIDDQSTLLPEVTLCGADGTQKMQCLDTSPTDNIVGYQLKNSEVGDLKKIRVGVDRKQRLNVLPEEGTDPKPRVYIKKIRVIDAVNGDEVRFPAAKVELFEFSVFEFPAIWPDIQPMDSVFYEVTISSGKSSYTVPFNVHFNFIGEFGDTGVRYLGEPDASVPTEFEPDSQKSFQLEAVSLGEVQKIEAFVETPGNEEFSWHCREVVVSDPETGLFFVFHFQKPFNPVRNRQTAEVSPFTSAL
ncbi:hypothetical protein FO519_007343 [Halicephalobus sp. NKZ332]|nr:hypothetical protein FO519_007343 [Halicephalobus sp. NKZ332]